MFNTGIGTRLLRIARRPLLNLENSRAEKQQQDARPNASARSAAVLRHASLEFDHLRKQGHTPRLEYLVGLAHLAYAFPGETSQQRLHKSATPLLDDIFILGTNDIEAPTESSAPLAYFVSYPRSGNTLAMRLAAMATRGQVLSAMHGTVAPFSKRIYPKTYSLPRLVKDHVAHRHYLKDRCVLIVRDGRDTVISLAFMTLQGNAHNFSEKGAVADFIRWTDKSYPFGSWASHVRDMMVLLEGPDKLLIRYENLIANKKAYLQIMDFFDPSNPLPEKRLTKYFDDRDRIVDRIKANAPVNEKWGFGQEFEPSSMFHEWSLNRKGSTWRETWDAAAKRAFHETGGTDALIELGYETDPDWWRQ